MFSSKLVISQAKAIIYSIRKWTYKTKQRLAELAMTNKMDLLTVVQRQRFESEYWQLQTKNSKIVPFFDGKNVLVTGATGFLGKLLVEKLLRANANLGKVFLIVRPKLSQDEKSRVANLCSEMIFNPLRKTQPHFEKKIVVLKGDISLPDLGLCTEDVKIITEQVNIIYHIAATVRFDEHLSRATFINVRGTRDLLNIASRCEHLEAFAHVSTAFSNCVHKEINEQFYEAPYSANQLIEMAENGEITAGNSGKLIGKWPNTYAFTKAVAENAVQDWKGEFPICILRPGIVLATYKEPIRSWVDSLNGATGIAVGGGTGLLKTLHCDGNAAAEVVPADYTINALIVASYQAANEKPKDVPIYNYVSSVENRITYRHFVRLSQIYGDTIPTIKCVWYQCLTLNSNKYIHKLYVIFVHYLPALLVDAGMVITGRKAKMTRIYKRIHKLLDIVAYFAYQEWKFNNENVQNLWKHLPAADKEVFPFSMSEMNWEDYQSTHLLGLRLFLLKDDFKTIPEARKKWKRFYVAHVMIKYTFRLMVLFFIAYIFSCCFGYIAN